MKIRTAPTGSNSRSSANAKRSDGAPETSVAEELRQDLEEVAAFEGSRAEQLLMVFCKQIKLRYNKLTEDEKQALIMRAKI